MDSESQRAPADAETRRLTLAKLADHLESLRVAITDQWLLAVRRDPEIAAADLYRGMHNREVVPRRGIGLAITKDLVDLLGGAIQVITESGGGTVIDVVLPTGREKV